MDAAPSGLHTMQSTRRLLERHAQIGGLLGRKIDAIEKNLVSYPDEAIDLSKKLLETTCRTILHERDVEVGDGVSVQKLLKQTLSAISLYEADHPENKKVQDRLSKLAGQLGGAIQSLGELRNLQGGHGVPAHWPSLEPMHAEFIASVADGLTTLLFEAHFANPTVKTPKLFFENHKEFNNYLDDLYPDIEVLGIKLSASAALFDQDPNAYRNTLVEFTEKNGGKP